MRDDDSKQALRSSALWLSAFWFLFLGGMGVFMPFFPLFLTSAGLSSGDATRVLALSPVMGVIAPPLVGLLADRYRARGWMLRALTAATALVFLGFLLPGGRIGLVVSAALYALFRAPVWSMIDATALDVARRGGPPYGRMRAAGSLGFVVAVTTGGLLMETAGAPTVRGLAAVLLAGAAGVVWLLPRPPAPRVQTAILPAWGALLARRDLWVLLAAVVLGQMGASAYDSGFTLHLRRLGFGASFTALAWSVGVLAEIVMLQLVSRLVTRWGAAPLLAFAYAVASLRWLLLGQATSSFAILALAPLHGITFPLVHVPAVTLVQRGAAPEVATAAQGLLGAAAACGSILGMSIWGTLLERGGGGLMYGWASVASLAALVATAAYLRTAAAPGYQMSRST